MRINLAKEPFSAYGSYMVISQLKPGAHTFAEEDGLYLRNIRGGSGSIGLGEVPVFRFSLNCKGKKVPYELDATPYEVEMKAECGRVLMTFADEKTLVIKGEGKDLSLKIDRITVDKSLNYVHPFKGHHMINCYKNCARYLLFAQAGEVNVSQVWDGEEAKSPEIVVNPVDGGFLFGLEEVEKEWEEKQYNYDYDKVAENRKNEIHGFMDNLPEVPEEYKSAKLKAAYIAWATVVKKSGYLKRDTIYMSKNWMTNVWAWDHCFNAIGLSYGMPELAWDQFMSLFDHQDETGLIPDFLNDSFVFWNCVKPPIHGWTLSKMLEHMQISDDQAEDAYQKLAKWTNWWFACRDDDKDGICEYYHGNDSGWDNGSVFNESPVVASPDLSAFLITQMDVLAELAKRIGKENESYEWVKKSDEMLSRMLKYNFDGHLPKAFIPHTRKWVESDSLLPYISILIGDKLPAEYKDAMIKVLKSDKFLTEYGYATEAIKSDKYVRDGYWRGAIWPPATLLLIDGLKKSGEYEMAKETARKFCDMAKNSGFTENYDAISGSGLRDNAYTWSATALVSLANDYLL